jgi:hypothetical protein
MRRCNRVTVDCPERIERMLGLLNAQNGEIRACLGPHIDHGRLRPMRSSGWIKSEREGAPIGHRRFA